MHSIKQVCLVILLVSCGAYDRRDCYLDGKCKKPVRESCAVTQTRDTLEIVCPDSSASVPIPAGSDGATGARGETGPAGADGAQGTPGETGQSGTGCNITDVENGALITCGDQSVVILDGAPGPAGPAGEPGEQGPAGEPGPAAPPAAYSVTELIDPCGDGPGFDEVLLRLADGSLLAHYSHGQLQFLSLIGPGWYRTTDQQSCLFQVTESGDVVW